MAETDDSPAYFPVDTTDASERTGGAKVVRSAERALRILRFLARSSEGRHLGEVSAAESLHKTTALRLLRTLVAEGVVSRDGAGRYAPSASFWVALEPFLDLPRSLLADAQETLDTLARQANGTALIELPDETGRRMYAPMFGLPQVQVYLNPAGSEPAPLHATAAGKCYLANLPRERLSQYLLNGLERLTDATVVSAASLREELEAVREQGYALNRGEAIAEFPGVAVPLKGPDAAVVGGLALAFFSPTQPEASVGEALSLLRRAAASLEELLSDADWARRVRAFRGQPQPQRSQWDYGDLDFHETGDQLVRSVSRLVRLMALILRHPEGISLHELAKVRQLERSATRRLLWTLESGGLARRDATTAKYRSHPLMWVRLASALRSSSPLRGSVRSLLERLADAMGCTACLVVRDASGRRAVTLQFALPSRPIVYHPGRAEPPPLHASASGKCLLAHQSQLSISKYIEGGLEGYTAHTITSPASFRRHLSAVKEAGFAISREEYTPGVGALSVPVPMPDGSGPAAVATALPVHELTEERVRQWLPRLRIAAASLAGMLGMNWREHFSVEPARNVGELAEDSVVT